MSLSEESSLLDVIFVLLGYLALVTKALTSFETSENIKVQFKEVKNTTSLLSVVMLLIERHVSAHSEAIIRFNKR